MTGFKKILFPTDFSMNADKLLIGTTADKLLTKASTPILTVKL